MPYFNDDGTEVNPDFYPKPGLCLICKLNDDPEEEIMCTLTRIDQRKDHEFICYGHSQNNTL